MSNEEAWVTITDARLRWLSVGVCAEPHRGFLPLFCSSIREPDLPTSNYAMLINHLNKNTTLRAFWANIILFKLVVLLI